MQASVAGDAELGLGVVSGARFFDIRAYRVTNPALVDKTVAELEALLDRLVAADAFSGTVLLARDGDIVDLPK